MVTGCQWLSYVSIICRVVDPHRTLQKIWGCFLYRVYNPGEWLWINSNGKMETMHPVKVYYRPASWTSIVLLADVCRLSSSVTLPAGWPAGRRARGRSSGRYCTAVVNFRRSVIIAELWRLKVAIVKRLRIFCVLEKWPLTIKCSKCCSQCRIKVGAVDASALGPFKK